MNEKIPEQTIEGVPTLSNVGAPLVMPPEPAAAVPETVDPAACLNCGTPAPGKYCSVCGQLTDTSVPTLFEFLSDFANDLFSYDSRLWRTLGTLLFRPGRLTLAWLAGQRARYVAPMRLYLAMSIVMFLVYSLPKSGDDPALGSSDVEFVSGGDGCEIDAGWLDNDAVQRIENTCNRVLNDREARRAMGRTFVDNLPLLAFLTIPVMAAFFKLFYLFTGRAYLEHLAFLTHNHALLFCTLTTIELLKLLDNVLPVLAAPVQVIAYVLVLLYLPVYFFLSLRRVYAQHFLLTLVKFPLLMLVYSLVAIWIFSAGFFVAMMTL